MQLMLISPKQHEIADLLWAADTQKDVDAVVRVFGHEAIVIRDLMVAAAFDEVTDLTDAQEVLRNF